MENLTPEEVRYLQSVPPYHIDYDDIMEQHFGDDYPEYVCDFLHNLLDLVRNFEVLKEKRRKEEEKWSADESSLKNFIDSKAKSIDRVLEELVVRLEAEFVAKKEVGRKVEAEGGKAELPLSSIIGYLYTLKIDIKAMMEYLKSDTKMYENRTQ